MAPGYLYSSDYPHACILMDKNPVPNPSMLVGGLGLF